MSKTKRILVGAGAVLALLVVLRVGAALVWPTINDVRTGATPEYPDLRTQRFDRPYGQVFAAALAAALNMELQVTAQSIDTGEIKAVATTPVFRFQDDVTIEVKRDGSGTKVDIRSRSRTGKGDFGTNARRIRAIQEALERHPGLVRK